MRTTNLIHHNPSTTRRSRPHLLAAVLLSSLAAMQASAPLQAQSVQQHVLSLDIQAGPLDAALSQLGTEGGLTLLYSPALVVGKTTSGASGRHTPAEALRLLLKGTGLTWDARGDSTFVLRKEAGDASASTRTPSRDSRPEARTEEPAITDLSQVVVTGTRIRGGTTPSPVIVIGSENFREEGFTDLGEVIRNVPQNFNGGQNPGVAVGGSSAGGIANQNVTGGSSLNLRGLGPDATLTLLNGRRLSYGGFVQAVDISAIPIEAVERLEIVADGASAIYGSDAVGGVGNVILKQDYDGVTASVRYGGATDGGMASRDYSLTAGMTWSSGGMIATYKYSSVDPIYARTRAYTDHLADPTTIYPGSEQHSGLLSVRQSLGDRAELRLDALRTERDQLYYYYFSGSALAYNRITPKTTTSLISSALELPLVNDWALSFGATLGEDEHTQVHSQVNTSTGAATPLIDACWGCNRSLSYDVGAEGPLFAMPGGDTRLAVGAGYRENRYRQLDHLANATTTEGTESARFAYVEIDIPLAGPSTSIAGVERLAFTAAVRGEDYDSFGSVVTPKLGLIYGPSQDLTIKASWGKSFKAPTLYQKYYTSTVDLYQPSLFGGTQYPAGSSMLVTGGGNTELRPERATSWSISLALHPENLAGFEADITLFDIDYTDRVISPITDFSNALNNPNYAEFIEFHPTPARQAEIIARYPRLNNWSGSAYNPDNVVAAVFMHYVNVAQQRTRGVDISSSYRHELGSGQLTLRGSASYLDSSQRNSAGQDAYTVAGTLFNPARINSRVGAIWNDGVFSASAFVNYTSGVSDTTNGEDLASFTTLDATLRFTTGYGASVLSGLEFALSAQNIFDRNPPIYRAVLERPPYDSTNYSAVGRFLSLTMSKHW